MKIKDYARDHIPINTHSTPWNIDDPYEDYCSKDPLRDYREAVRELLNTQKKCSDSLYYKVPKYEKF